jgi:drug/metabolite transporter (DMT)-like permease
VQRRAALHTGVMLTLTIHITITAVLLVLVAAVTGELAPPASVPFWVAVVLTAVFPTLAAYGLYWWLLRRVGITVLNALLFLIAPATALAGGLLLGESLTVVTVAGFALCGIGVAVVLAGEARTAREDATPPADVDDSRNESASRASHG